MPSANTVFMQLKSFRFSQFRQWLRHLADRLFRRERRPAPDLPPELCRDVGLGDSFSEMPAEDRAEAFWNGKPDSRLRNMPF